MKSKLGMVASEIVTANEICALAVSRVRSQRNGFVDLNEKQKIN